MGGTIIQILLSTLWVPIFVLDMLYENLARPGKGTGPLSKWLAAHFLNKLLIETPIFFGQFALSFSLLLLGETRAASITSYVLFWIPLAIFDIVDWLGEEDRYKRIRKGSSEKIKQLLARLKPAPQRPLPIPN